MYAFRGAHQARDAKKKLDLRDETGERVIAGRRAAGRAAITEPVLRREVAVDLGNLMNTVNLASSLDLHKFSRVRSSILNYGFPDVAHRSIDEESLADIKDEIDTVLSQFEPRLAKDSIEIARDESIHSAELKIRFIVRADLCCDPLNVPVEFVADLELDTGKIHITRL
jgi:type VI secretion system protein ImpF